jgi:hypothetical protein
MYLFHLAAQSYPLHLPPSIDLPHIHTHTSFHIHNPSFSIKKKAFEKKEGKTERKTMFVDKLEDLNVNGF